MQAGESTEGRSTGQNVTCVKYTRLVMSYTHARKLLQIWSLYYDVALCPQELLA